MPLTHAVVWVGFSILIGVLGFAPSARADSPTKRECVAVSEAGQDLRVAGQLLEARVKFSACTSTSCPRPVREDCAQRLLELDHSLPTLVLAAKDPQGNDLLAVSVSLDDRPIRDRLDGTAIEVDPGEHRFHFEMDGKPPVDKTLVVREGEKNRVIEVVLGTPLPPAPPPAPAPAVFPVPRTSDGSTQRTIGLAVAGGGALAAIVGAALSVASKVLYDHALHDECQGQTHGHCSPQGIADGRTVQTEATGATVAFVAGGVLLAGGGITYFTAPRRAAVTPTVGRNSAGLAIELPW
jgi:hypothetical protein